LGDLGEQWEVQTLVFSDQQDCTNPATVAEVQSSGSENGVGVEDSRVGAWNAFDTNTPNPGEAPSCSCGYSSSFKSDNKPYNPGEAWIGAKLNETVDVKCIRISQSTDELCGVCTSLRLESSIDGSAWVEVETWGPVGKSATMLVGKKKPSGSVWVSEPSECQNSTTCLYAPIPGPYEPQWCHDAGLLGESRSPAPASGPWTPAHSNFCIPGHGRVLLSLLLLFVVLMF
jgi:hypothetical protein